MGVLFYLYEISFTMIFHSSFSFFMFEANYSYDMCLSICSNEIQIGILMGFSRFWYVNFFHMLNCIVQFH